MDTSMQYILDKFGQCNIFSLTSALQVKSIPATDKKRLLDENLNDEKQYLLDRYEYFLQNEHLSVDFEALFNDIVKECEQFCEDVKNSNFPITARFNGTSPFICDHVGKDTKYSEPRGLIWHFYHNIQNVLMANEDLANMPETKTFQLDTVVQNTDSALVNNFVRHEYTFTSHCTKGPLQLVLYFRLNDETKKWLLQFKTDFDLEGSTYEDLALYSDEKLEFSSCTHEGFNSLDDDNF